MYIAEMFKTMKGAGKQMDVDLELAGHANFVPIKAYCHLYGSDNRRLI